MISKRPSLRRSQEHGTSLRTGSCRTRTCRGSPFFIRDNHGATVATVPFRSTLPGAERLTWRALA